MKVVPLNRDALKRVGVTLHKSGDGWWLLSCDKCGAAWALPKHIIPISYWQCSNRCNCPKPKPAPKPEPEAEPTAQDRERDRLRRELAFARETMETTTNPETRRRFEVEAARLLDKLVGSEDEEMNWEPEPVTQALIERDWRYHMALQADNDEDRERWEKEAEAWQKIAFERMEVEDEH